MRPGWHVRTTITFSMTVVLVSAPALAAGAPRSGAGFRGRTAQGFAVSLGPLRSGERTFHYQARLTCSDGTTFTDDAFTDLVREAHGRFSRAVTSDRGAVHTRVTGFLHGTRAAGTIAITERYSQVPDARGDTPLNADGGTLCQSGTVRWSARTRARAR